MSKSQTSDGGSVTAEFAVVLPAVFMVISIAIGALSLQVERMRLVGLAAELARASGRGESEQTIRQLYGERIGGSKVDYSSDGLFSCVEVSTEVELLGLPTFTLRLADRECARTVGL
ncbi:MAG: hypothetical protein RL149_681 [Actinomycetota bacterium]|jgi:hypothetical protein